jgi:hypothetical protein
MALLRTIATVGLRPPSGACRRTPIRWPDDRDLRLPASPEQIRSDPHPLVTMPAPACPAHPDSQTAPACRHIAEALAVRAGAHLLPAHHELLFASHPSVQVVLCTPCGSLVGVEVDRVPIPEARWHRALDLTEVCAECTEQMVAAPHPLAACEHRTMIVDYAHPHGDIPGVRFRDLIASDPRSTRPVMSLHRPRCADCGQSFRAATLGNRIAPGGDLFDSRFVFA